MRGGLVPQSGHQRMVGRTEGLSLGERASKMHEREECSETEARCRYQILGTIGLKLGWQSPKQKNIA